MFFNSGKQHDKLKPSNQSYRSDKELILVQACQIFTQTWNKRIKCITKNFDSWLKSETGVFLSYRVTVVEEIKFLSKSSNACDWSSTIREVQTRILIGYLQLGRSWVRSVSCGAGCADRPARDIIVSREQTNSQGCQVFV